MGGHPGRPFLILVCLRSARNIHYLTIYTLAKGTIKGTVGEKFKAGRLGEYTIMDDPNLGPSILLGPPFVYNKDNIDQFNW